jgi:hypothetical protein
LRAVLHDLEPQPKFVPIDEQLDDDIMHLNRLGETDRLACQPLDPGSQCEMLALNLLCVSFARLVLMGIDMTHVRAPIVRVIAHDAKWLQQRFEVQI